jgi:DNA-binding XRE family transcriptional regulator
VQEVRLDEVPELQDIAHQLQQLSILDIRIGEYERRGESTFFGVIVIRNGDQAVPWFVAPRADRDSVVGAIQTLLRGAARGRLDAITLFPSVAGFCETETAFQQTYREFLGITAPKAERPRRHKPRRPRVGPPSWNVDDLARWADQLKQTRMRWGWSQGELARRIGKTQAFVSQIERGVTPPTLETATSLSEALDLELPKVVQ